jgi:hypothetical protein
VTYGTLLDNLFRFGGLGGFSKHNRLTMNILWLFIVWVIRKERNGGMFYHKEEQLQTLGEKKLSFRLFG